jgi:hypothetical protein
MLRGVSKFLLQLALHHCAWDPHLPESWNYRYEMSCPALEFYSSSDRRVQPSEISENYFLYSTYPANMCIRHLCMITYLMSVSCQNISLLREGIMFTVHRTLLH